MEGARGMKHAGQYALMALASGACVLFLLFTGKALLDANAEAPGPPAAIQNGRTDVYIRTEWPPDPAATASSEQDPEPEPFLARGEKILYAGNSLACGLRAVNANPEASFLCKTGISLPSLDGMLPGSRTWDAAVLVMGTNELGLWSEADFKSAYGSVLDKLGPRTACLSVPPVCQEKSRYGPRTSSANAALYSSWIKDACEEKGAVFVDCAEFFGDELDPELTGDGLHLTADGYRVWLAWLEETLYGE